MWSQKLLPLFLLLQQTYHDNLIAQEEISRLRNIIKEDKIRYEELSKINLSLSSKLELADANLVVSNETVEQLQKKLNKKEKEAPRY